MCTVDILKHIMYASDNPSMYVCTLQKFQLVCLSGSSPCKAWGGGSGKGLLLQAQKFLNHFTTGKCGRSAPLASWFCNLRNYGDPSVR